MLPFLDLIERDDAIVLAAIVHLIMRAASLCLWLHVNHGLLVQDLYLIEQFWVLLLNLVPVLINLLKLLRELRKALKELLYHDDTEHQALAISAESLYDKLKSDSLQDIVEQTILDNCSKQFSNLGEVDMRVLVQESVFVKETM